MVYKEDIKYEGVSGYRMIPGPEFLGDPNEYKDAACYAPGSIKGYTTGTPMLKKGVLDASSCLCELITNNNFYLYNPAI